MWGESWGSMIWGGGSTPVPMLGSWGLLLLVAALAAIAALKLSKRRGSRFTLLMLVALAVPLAAYAATIGVPNTFVNGQTADADAVNANFDTVANESNDQDGRLSTLESTDITDVSTGLGLTGGGSSGNLSLDVDTGYIQRRVSASCVAGSSIRTINSDGTVVCESIPTSAAEYNDPTTSFTNPLSAPSLVDSGNPSFDVDPAGTSDLNALNVNSISGFFSGGCGDNQHVTSISSSGAVSCSADSADISGVSVGGGLSGGATSGAAVVSHADTSAQGSINGASGNVIQDVTVDTFGHVTTMGQYNLDSRYYTESESNTNYVNANGDTMTGSLTLSNGNLSVANSSAYVYANGTSSSGHEGVWFLENGFSRFYMLTANGVDTLDIYNYVANAFASRLDGPTNEFTFFDEANFDDNVDVGGTLYAGLETVSGSAASLTSTAPCGTVNSGTCYYTSTTASCSAGKVALSGGCNCSSSYNCYIGDSYQDSSTSWLCRAVASSSGYLVTPTVTCARMGD